jgi:hypothetical protein
MAHRLSAPVASLKEEAMPIKHIPARAGLAKALPVSKASIMATEAKKGILV